MDYEEVKARILSEYRGYDGPISVEMVCLAIHAVPRVSRKALDMLCKDGSLVLTEKGYERI